MADVSKKAKLTTLKKKLNDLQKETLKAQHKLDHVPCSSSHKTGSKTVPEIGNKAVSSQDLQEFEELPQAVEKRLGKMGLSASTSEAAADESTSSEESDNDSWTGQKS